MYDKSIEMIIKWLACSLFSINIAQAEFYFVSEVLATPKSLHVSGFKANIILSRMRHNIATA